MRRIAEGDVITRNFVSVKPSASLHECVRIMIREEVNSLIITQGSKLLGILTARDVLKKLIKNSNSSLKEIKATDIAAKRVAVIKPSADLSQAIQKMHQLNFRRLPVLSNSKIVGVITFKDIISIEPSLYSEISDFMDIREEEEKQQQTQESWPLEGMCENCGALSDLLRVEDVLLCPDCRDDLY